VEIEDRRKLAIALGSQLLVGIVAGVVASGAVTWFYNAGNSPLTSPDLELREPVIGENSVKATIENKGKQSAKNKGVAITSRETDYAKTKYFDIDPESLKSRYFYDLPQGKLDKTLTPEKIKISVKNKSLADSICEDTEGSRNLSSSVATASLKFKTIWKKVPAKYTVALGDNETKEITQEKDLTYPLESRTVNTSINHLETNVELERTNGECYLSANSEALDLPRFEFHHTVDNYINKFN
jgi:hypothetical protein